MEMGVGTLNSSDKQKEDIITPEQEAIEKNRLTKDEAQDEASMLDYQARMDNKYMKDKESSFTKEDYDKAEEVINELIEKAKNESSLKKFMITVEEIMNKTEHGVKNLIELVTWGPEKAWLPSYERMYISAKEKLKKYKNRARKISRHTKNEE